MNIRTQQVLQHFLYMMLEQLQKQQTEELDPYFDDFFTKDEIIKILQSKYGRTVDGHLKVVRLNTEQLLEYLSHADILDYFLTAWKSENT